MPDKNNRPHLIILGTRGIPAAHGGFETFAQHFSVYLVQRGWRVTVYCQAPGGQPGPILDEWQGVRRVTISPASEGALGTMEFDWLSIRHASREDGLILVLGYNTAIFTLLFRLQRRPVLMNMDGIEWKRAKWSLPAKFWLFFNEQIGALLSTRLIADHPAIADHLASRRSRAKVVTIPYGGDSIEDAPASVVEAMGLASGRYLLSIGRIEPENSVLDMIQGYVSSKVEVPFVVLGKIDENNPYHRKVLSAGAGKVLFAGAIYDTLRVRALRFHALVYCHGHTVGGTNPSLVEALGAGNAVIAQDNIYNRWVAGEEQLYFSDSQSFAAALVRTRDDFGWLKDARPAARERFRRMFQWNDICAQYEALCRQFIHGE